MVGPSSSSSSSSSSVEQFIRFATDASGLERTFRYLQAIAQTLIFFAPARALFFRLLAFLSPENHVELQPIALAFLQEVRARFAIGRRYFRVFRFAESFHAAWVLFSSSTGGDASSSSPSSPGRGLDVWLDVSSRSFNGMYLLLETLTFPDALEVQGLSIWGQERNAMLVVEAQRFWFFALVCAVGSGVLKLRKGWVRVDEEEGKGVKGEKVGTKGGGDGKVEEGRGRLQREKNRRVLRRLVADALDLAVPGAVIGWVPASTGTVGVLMVGSTWLTGLEVWERCA